MSYKNANRFVYDRVDLRTTDERECDLHSRYLRLRRSGWSFVLWCEAGMYFIPRTPVKPDFNDKMYISLDDLEKMLTEAEHGKTTVGSVEANQALL